MLHSFFLPIDTKILPRRTFLIGSEATSVSSKSSGQTSSSSSAHARCTPNGRSSHAPSQHHRGLDVPCRKNCSNAVPSDISERLGIPDAPSQRTPFYRIHPSLNPASILLPGLLKPMLNRRQHRCHHLPGARRTQLYRGLDP